MSFKGSSSCRPTALPSLLLIFYPLLFKGHLFNNYYYKIIDTGINSRMGAKLRIEHNVFENAKDPIGSWYSSELGYWHVVNNQFINSTGSMPRRRPSTTRRRTATRSIRWKG